MTANKAPFMRFPSPLTHSTYHILLWQNLQENNITNNLERCYWRAVLGHWSINSVFVHANKHGWSELAMTAVRYDCCQWKEGSVGCEGILYKHIKHAETTTCTQSSLRFLELHLFEHSMMSNFLPFWCSPW